MERITVDGQMSTNDTVLLQATGASGAAMPRGLLEAVLLQLALEIVADGEGATRVGRSEEHGARARREAERVARAIANSPLVKTALFGRDPTGAGSPRPPGWRWRGRSSRSWGPTGFKPRSSPPRGPRRSSSINLGRGKASAHVYFSDLTHDYIRINAEYTT